MKQLLEAGVHFGHQTRRWNPKMAEYIFTKEESCSFIMFNNIKPIPLHCVFHGIRFKVNEDWVSGIDTFFFYIPFLYMNMLNYSCD